MDTTPVPAADLPAILAAEADARRATGSPHRIGRAERRSGTPADRKAEIEALPTTHLASASPAESLPRASASRRRYADRLRAIADAETLHLFALPMDRGGAASRPLGRTAAVARVALLLGLLLLGLRAGLESASFMSPGGDIVGWSRIPKTQCTLCNVVVPTPTGQHKLTPAEYAAALQQHLTLDQELSQMLLVQFVGQSMTPDAFQMIHDQQAGGVLLFALNINSADQVRALNAALQQNAPIPLLISVDQEGGRVNRFSRIIGPVPAASTLADPAAARSHGEQDAVYLHDYGFNLNLAPVADVGTANPQLYTRTFGSDPARVAAMAGAYLEGLQKSGTISACVKHYPGIGATDTDPHYGLPVLNRSRTDWERIDLEPYRQMLANQDVRAIMVSHEMIPAVDRDLPSSLSPTIIDGTLRQELGYEGVVISDSLYMGALNARYSVPQAAVLAVKAGVDLLIGPDSPAAVRQVRDALKQAVADGTLTQERIDTSVLRILELKIRTGLIAMPQQTDTGTPSPTPSKTPTRSLSAWRTPALAEAARRS